MVIKTILDIIFRVVIIMIVIIGYEVGSHLDGTPETIVMFGTGFIGSFLIGLYGEWIDKFYSQW